MLPAGLLPGVRAAGGRLVPAVFHGHTHRLVLRKERRRYVFPEHCQIYPAHAGIDMVPLQPSVNRIEVPVGLEYEVSAVGAEYR